MEINLVVVFWSAVYLAVVTGLTTGESELSFREKRSVDSSLDLSDGNALVQEPEVRRRQQTFRDRHRMELYIIPGTTRGGKIDFVLEDAPDYWCFDQPVKESKFFAGSIHTTQLQNMGVLLGVPLIIVLTCGVKAAVETCHPRVVKKRKSGVSGSPGTSEKRLGSGRKWVYWRPPTVTTATRNKRAGNSSHGPDAGRAGTRPDSAFHLKEFPFTSPEPKSFQEPYYLTGKRKGRQSVTTQN